MKYIRKVLAALRKADERFSLIDKGDRILIGVSGGKDSLCLLKVMSIYGMFAKKDFTIVPAVIDLGFDGFDPQPLKDYCATLGLNLHVDDSRFVYDVLKAHQEPGKHIPCSICSRMKKAAMANLAKKLHCNKISFAHHKDDAVETLFMNMIHGARVSTFEPKMRLSKSGTTFIRPLILCREDDLTGMAKEEELPVLSSHCPADKHTDREKTKLFLENLYKTYPDAERNFEEMLSNHKSFKLYFETIEYQNPFDPSLSLRPLTHPDDVLTFDSLSKKHPELGSMKSTGENFLVLYKHKIIGTANVDQVDAHDVTISNLNELKDRKDVKTDVAKHIMEMVSSKLNPVVFTLKSDKKTAESLGFSKVRSSYKKKIIK